MFRFEFGAIDHRVALSQGGRDRFATQFRVFDQHRIDRARLGQLIEDHGYRYPGAGYDRFAVAASRIDLDLAVHTWQFITAYAGAMILKKRC